MKNRAYLVTWFSGYYELMEGNEVYLEGLSEGQVVKHHRIARGFRQIDLASSAHCDLYHIINLEKDRWVRPDIRERILVALGLWEGVGDGQ